jgi:hypothetical protein
VSSPPDPDYRNQASHDCVELNRLTLDQAFSDILNRAMASELDLEAESLVESQQS